MEKITGRIIKGIGGFYTVKPSDSLSIGAPTIETKARGVFRHQKLTPMVGDMVDVSVGEDQSYISMIHPRTNMFPRPPVANVDIALLVFAVAEPEPDLLLLDKLLISAIYRNTHSIICLTKTDLTTSEKVNEITEIYSEIGFTVLHFHQQDDDFDLLEKALKDHTAFMAGPSGVGKSTLTNRLCGTIEMETGSISKKLGRGKHTTRHVELIELPNGGMLLDTPGFSSLDPEKEIPFLQLSQYYPEFPIGKCRFNTCTHRSEPNCAVKAAVEAKKIAPQRYENYLSIFSAMEKSQRRM